MNANVDALIARSKNWEKELRLLRSLVLECGLQEDFKWKQPCYTHKGANLVILGQYKESVVLSFLKGALLADEENLLEKPGENSQSAKVMKFKNTSEIKEKASSIKSYIYEAIEAEKAGLKVEFKTEKGPIPEELEIIFSESEKFKKAFFALTPGKQRGYLLFFNGAKQSKTITSRIEKYQARILKGYGFHDCVCGLTKKKPSCDGSHKSLKTPISL